jgi:hypothetical protein
MNPLSPVTYCRRQKKSTLALLALIALVTLGFSVMVRLPDSFVEHMFYSESYMTRVSLVSAIGSALDPGLVSQIRTHPDVARVMQEMGLFVTWPPISGSSHLFGLSESDMPVLLDVCDLRLVEGRLPRPHTNELVLSETMANGAKVWIGDEIGRASNGDWFAAIPSPLVVVGILTGDGPDPVSSPPLAIVSYEYVRDHERFAPFWAPGLVIVAREGREDAVSAFLEEAVSPYGKVWTNRQLQARVKRVSRNFHLMFGAVDGLVVVGIALVVGITNRMVLSRRLAEPCPPTGIGDNGSRSVGLGGRPGIGVGTLGPDQSHRLRALRGESEPGQSGASLVLHPCSSGCDRLCGLECQAHARSARCRGHHRAGSVEHGGTTAADSQP